MVVVISLGSQTSKPFLSKKCINIICCKGRNVFVYGAKEIVYRTAVRSNGRFLQVPLHGFTVDLFENIFVLSIPAFMSPQSGHKETAVPDMRKHTFLRKPLYQT